MPQFNFGSGLLFTSPTNGVGPANVFGTLQDVATDYTSDTKKLYGAFDFPDIALNGHSTGTIKAKFGQISGALFNSIYFGGTSSPGMMLLQLLEAQTIPSTPTNGSYTVTATNATGPNIVTGSVVDLTVRYAASGVALVNSGAVAPTQGQYQVSAGVYTFAAADAGAQVLLTYSYKTNNVGSGTTYTRNQQLVGTTVFFSMFLFNSLNGLQSNTKYFRVKSSKLSRATKNDDFTVPEMDFEMFADPAGRVFETYESSY